MRLLELGNLVKSRISVRQEALPHMQVLHEELGETVNLSVRHEDEVPPAPFSKASLAETGIGNCTYHMNTAP